MYMYRWLPRPNGEGRSRPLLLTAKRERENEGIVESKKERERERERKTDNRSIDGHKRDSFSFLSPAFIYCFVLRSIMLSLLFIKWRRLKCGKKGDLLQGRATEYTVYYRKKQLKPLTDKQSNLLYCQFRPRCLVTAAQCKETG